LFNLLDITAYNALVVWITANPDWQREKSDVRRRFLREFGIQLVTEHATARSTLPQGKRRRIQDCARQSSIITSSAAVDTSPVRKRPTAPLRHLSSPK